MNVKEHGFIGTSGGLLKSDHNLVFQIGVSFWFIGANLDFIV